MTCTDHDAITLDLVRCKRLSYFKHLPWLLYEYCYELLYEDRVLYELLYEYRTSIKCHTSSLVPFQTSQSSHGNSKFQTIEISDKKIRVLM